MNKKSRNKDPKKAAVRIVCILLAALLILSSVAAIFGLFD